MAEYYVRKVPVTALSEDILFSNLTDFNSGNSLPTFTSAPFVAIIGKYQETKGIVSGVSTTGFTITRSGRYAAGESMYYNLKIVGE